MDIPQPHRKYTQEEKQQLLANLDIEVAHRTRQFESWLQDRLENFTMHQEGQILRIPKQVRNMTMREFGDKYNADVQEALRGVQKEKLVAAGGIGTLGELDKDARKRKWVESHENLLEEKDGGSKGPKTARLNSPKKAGSSTGPGTAQGARIFSNGNKTPAVNRTWGRVAPSPSPQKKPPFGSNLGYTFKPRVPSSSRPTSPAKPSTSRQPSSSRVPSSSNFNPDLPSKTPRYPVHDQHQSMPTSLRLPTKDERMLSLNGSPLANPYQFGLGWLKGIEAVDGDTEAETSDREDQLKPRTIRSGKSSIVIRRDPSLLLNADSTLHSRTTSQSSFHTAPSLSSSQTSQEETQPVEPADLTVPRHDSQRPTSHSQPMDTKTPQPMRHTHSFSALVAIPTKDGHMLEFDPLLTSPGTLDALEGISDSAKKHARMEMGRLVSAAMEKWKVG